MIHHYIYSNKENYEYIEKSLQVQVLSTNDEYTITDYIII